MASMSTRTSLLGIAIALSALTFASTQMSAADDAQPAAAATTSKPGGVGKNRFFELRIYTAAPGKMEALHKRFRDHALRFFEKHGIQSVGYWTGVDEKHQGKIYYIIAYPDQASREKMLVNGIAKDPEFIKAVIESEKGGKLVESVEEVFLAPTDYSPIK
jgi:NIPSNAP